MRRTSKRTDEPGKWVGRGAKRFDNQGEWAGMYAMMGVPTFAMTAPVFVLGEWLRWGREGQIDYSFPTLLLAASQLFLLVYAIALSHSFAVWIGENGMEVRTLGLGVKRFAWSQIVRVELYRTFGMRCVRVFLVGKPSPVYLPLYLRQSDGFFGEVAQWLGRKPVPETVVQSPLVSPASEVNAPVATQTELPVQPTQQIRRM